MPSVNCRRTMDLLGTARGRCIRVTIGPQPNPLATMARRAKMAEIAPGFAWPFAHPLDPLSRACVTVAGVRPSLSDTKG